MVVRLWEQTSDRVKKKKSTYIFLSRRTELVSSDKLENSIIFSIRRHFIESTSHPHLGYGKISVKWCNAHFFMTSFFEMIIQVLVNAKVAVLSKYLLEGANQIPGGNPSPLPFQVKIFLEGVIPPLAQALGW